MGRKNIAKSTSKVTIVLNEWPSETAICFKRIAQTLG
jgi:hypothetical protein